MFCNLSMLYFGATKKQREQWKQNHLVIKLRDLSAQWFVIAKTELAWASKNNQGFPKYLDRVAKTALHQFGSRRLLLSYQNENQLESSGFVEVQLDPVHRTR